MIRTPTLILIACLSLPACGSGGQQQTTNEPKIRVVSEEQKQLHQLDAFNLAIGLKRAIYDAGYTCKKVTDAGFVGTWENLDEWTAHCVYDNGSSRDWAIFAGPDGRRAGTRLQGRRAERASAVRDQEAAEGELPV